MEKYYKKIILNNFDIKPSPMFKNIFLFVFYLSFAYQFLPNLKNVSSRFPQMKKQFCKIFVYQKVKLFVIHVTFSIAIFDQIKIQFKLKTQNFHSKIIVFIIKVSYFRHNIIICYIYY